MKYGQKIEWYPNTYTKIIINVSGYDTLHEAQKEAIKIAIESGWKPVRFWQWWRWREVKYERIYGDMKTLFTIAIGILFQFIIYQTYPGTTVPDYTAPAYVQQGNQIYQTYEFTTIPDLTKPGLVIERKNPYVWPIGNKYRTNQPMQQDLPYVWPAPYGARTP